MPNDLVRWGGADGHGGRSDEPNALGHYGQAGEEWDLPPEQMGYGRSSNHSLHTERTENAARQADADAVSARLLGDGTFSAMRETDAADLRQQRWDWGDLRTWRWLFGMCAVFLLMVALCYFLPYGRHASPPPIRPY